MPTAKSAEMDQIVGLMVGADDNLTKPLSLPELLARIKVIVQRGRSDKSGDEGTLTFDPIRIGGQRHKRTFQFSAA